MARCRRCGAEITWITMDSGRSHPFNREDVAFIHDETYKTMALFHSDGLTGHGFQVGESHDGPWEYAKLSHMATCKGDRK